MNLFKLIIIYLHYNHWN